jgi:hypothetical protein
VPSAQADAPVKEKEEVKTVKVDYKCSDFLEEVSKYDWDVDTVMKIMALESGCVPTALNNNPHTRDYSVGLMQINLFGGNAASRPSEEWLKIPENNIAYAYELYKSPTGLNHWSVYKNMKK